MRASYIVVPAVLIGLFSLATGYLPGRQTYWDWKITQLCGADGGLTVFQKVHLSRRDVERGVLPRTWPSGVIGRGDPHLSFTVKGLSHPEAPIYAEVRETKLRDWNPAVVRREWTIVRRDNKATVGRWVVYQRGGGDFPIFIPHPSSFSCPDLLTESAEIHKRLFAIDG
jgi:hypothetical protein